ncbi:MAG: sigma-54 interaction domain-containing protein [Anaerotignaceae bacterium]
MPKELAEICVVTSFAEYAQKLKQQFAGMEEHCSVFIVNKSFNYNDLVQQGIKIFITANENSFIKENDKYEILNMGFSTMDCICAAPRNEIKGQHICITSANIQNINIDIVKAYFNTTVSILQPLENSKKLQLTNNENTLYFVPPEFFEVAEKAKINYKVLCHSKETLSQTLNVAKEILRVKNKEVEKNKENLLRMEQYKVVFNFTNDAILAIDEKGTIIAANDMVYKFLKWNPNDKLEGKRIDKIVKNTKMIDAMKISGGHVGDVFELPYCTVLTHRIPIEIDGKLKGVVSTFQDLAALQEHEKNARVNFYKNKKGFFAKYSFKDIRGSSSKIKEVINIAKSYAFSNSTVLILGETGTGKELFAQSIHNASPNSDGPFVAVNCAAIPKNLLEAEFFGYEEGSFTGASKGGKMGVFELAHKGTIFLDEIGEMPLDMQAQLLRVIQEKEIRRIGSDKVVPIEVRVISATNRDLQNQVKKGLFREDLFYRINVLELKIPPLRERPEDIKEISVDYLTTFNFRGYKANINLWNDLLEELKKYHMPGNIRELQNILERLSVMLENKHINTNALFAEIGKGLSTYEQTDFKKHNSLSLEENSNFTKNEAQIWEKNKILEALKNNNFSRTKAATQLGISRTTLWNKMKYYKIQL